MAHLIKKAIFIALFVIFFNFFTPTTSAIQSTTYILHDPSFVCVSGNSCNVICSADPCNAIPPSSSGGYVNSICNPSSHWCSINPFCRVYTGTTCCPNVLTGSTCQPAFSTSGLTNPSFTCSNPSLPYNGFYCYIAPTPTPTSGPTPTPGPTATPTPIPCRYNDPGGDGYPEQCIDQNGTHQDNCTSNNQNIYFCDFSTNLCTLSSSFCGSSTCIVETNGEPACIAPTPTPTPPPPPGPCEVTTNPNPVNLVVGQQGGITANVTSGLETAAISQMLFGSYNTVIATVNPTVDSISIYQTTVTAAAVGATAVWATAVLDDGRVCQSTGTTDTDINVLAPTPTPTPLPPGFPTPTPTPIGAPTATPTPIGGGGPTSTPTPIPTPTPTPIGGWQVCNMNTYSDSSCTNFIGTAVWPCSSPNQFAAGDCRNYSAEFARSTSCSPCVPPPTPTPTPGSGIYRIEGFIYIDLNKNGIKDASEVGYSGVSGNLLGDIYFEHPSYGSGWINRSVFSPGWYHIDNLEQNTTSDNPYIIRYGGLPTDYEAIRPPLSPPDFPNKPGYKVKVGSPCVSWRDSMALTYPWYNYTCYNTNQGFISGLNFGIYPPPPPKWFQAIGSDIRWDFKSSDPSFLTNIAPSGKYTLMPGVGGMPGILFSGAKAADLGGVGRKASADPFDWKVGSFSYPDVYTESSPLIATSYTFLSETAQKAAIDPLDLNLNLRCGTGGIANCNLDASLPHGLYTTNTNIANSDLVLEDPVDASYTFPANQNYIILVNGDLIIKEKILVPNTSTVLFSVKGNIKIDRSVGETAATSCNPDTHAGCTIEGFYSADKDFIADGIDNCSTGTDKRLNIAGSVIANAARVNAAFQNKRNLCDNNINYPSVTFIERPDFVFNFSKTYLLPTLLQRTVTSWKEVAP